MAELTSRQLLRSTVAVGWKGGVSRGFCRVSLRGLGFRV